MMVFPMMKTMMMIMMVFPTKKTRMMIVTMIIMILIMMVFPTMKTMMMTMMVFLTKKILMMTMMAFLMKNTRKRSQRMMLKRALLVLLGSPLPFLPLSLGALLEMSCDKKEQMNLLQYHFPYHYLSFIFQIFNRSCLNETFFCHLQ